MKKRLFAAVDLGGTKIYTVLADAQGNILSHTRLDTKAAAGPETVMEQIVSSVFAVLGQAGASFANLAGAGVCVAGFFDWQKRVLVHSPNMAGWDHVPVEKLLQGRLGVPVIAENDANAAALGEARHGAGAGSRHVVFITVSTGIGGGLVLDGKLYRGVRGLAGEVGHMLLEPDGPACGCGKKGCLEALASGTAIARMASEAVSNGSETALAEIVKRPVTAADVFRAAGAGDMVAKSIIDRAVHYLGIGLVNLANILNPEVIVIGGGVSEAGDAVFTPLRSVVKELAVKPAADSLVINKASLGVEAGVYGVLCLLQDQCGTWEG